MNMRSPGPVHTGGRGHGSSSGCRGVEKPEGCAELQMHVQYMDLPEGCSELQVYVDHTA